MDTIFVTNYYTNLQREETDSFKLGFIEVVDVPGERPRVVVERN